MTDVTVELLSPEARIMAAKAEAARLSAAAAEASAVRSGASADQSNASANRSSGASDMAVAAANRTQQYAAQLPNFVQGSPGASAAEVGLFSAAKAMTFLAAINRIRTTGRELSGDGGAAWYVRWVAGMTALAGEQQNYSWFQAADGSRWVLEAGQLFFPQQFGALGDASLSRTTVAQDRAVNQRGPDDAAAINAALAAPMVQTLTLTGQHWFGSDIRKPSSKHLRGVDRATCGFHRIPLVGNQVRAQFGIYSEDDDSGTFSDFFVNCQRSGYAGLPADNLQQLRNRCSGLIVRRDSRNVRVLRVDVYNSWGYSQYTCSGDAGNAGPAPRGIIREDCRAYNGDTCFEVTGLGASETEINCWGYKDPIDGGSSVYMECAFHSYSGISLIHRIRCGFRGSAPAVLDATADGVNSGTIINQDCDFETTGGQSAMIATNPNIATDDTKILDYRVINCRLVAAPIYDNGALPLSLLVDNATVAVDGGSLSGAVSVSTGAVVSFENGPSVVAYRPDGPVITALDIVGGSNGRIDWYGTAGSVIATHGTDPASAVSANDQVVFHDLPAMSPAKPTVFGIPPVRYRQRLTGEVARSEWQNPGGGDAFFNLALGLVNIRDDLEVSLSLRCPDGNTNAPDASISWNWLDGAAIRVTVSGNDSIPAGSAVAYVLAERL